MLPFQVFRPSPEFVCNELTVSHYLSCGSFKTPFKIQNLHEFSKYKVNPFSKFTNSERKKGKDVVFIVIKGEGKFDGKMVSEFGVKINPIQVSATENAFEFVRVTVSQQSDEQIRQKLNDNQIVGKSKWSINKYNIETGSQLTLSQKQNTTTFLYLNKGDLSIENKIRSLTQSESILLTSGTKIKANKPSFIITVQLNQK